MSGNSSLGQNLAGKPGITGAGKIMKSHYVAQKTEISVPANTRAFGYNDGLQPITQKSRDGAVAILKFQYKND
jgi:hypothetical protein